MRYVATNEAKSKLTALEPSWTTTNIHLDVESNEMKKINDWLMQQEICNNSMKYKMK